MDRYDPAFIIRDYDRCKQDRAEGSLSHRCRRVIVSWHRLGDIFALAAKKDQPEVYDTKRSFGSEATDVKLSLLFCYDSHELASSREKTIYCHFDLFAVAVKKLDCKCCFWKWNKRLAF